MAATLSARLDAASHTAEPARQASPSTEAGGLLTIDLGAIRENYRRLVAAAGGASVAGVVKADAYGLGIGAVAPALWDEGCRSFFVAQFVEALALRPLLPSAAEIFVLNGLADASIEACIEAGIRPVLNSLAQVEAFGRAASSRGLRLPAALQVDSGMSRLGMTATEVAAIARDPGRLAGIEVVLVMSHLACADDAGHPANEAQLAGFRELADSLPRARRSLANSGGIFLGPDYRFDLVRPGIALFGGNPQAGENPMRAVVGLEARVVQLREVPAGAGIGYGFHAVATAPLRLATIAVGYADGWPRIVGERGAAFFAGRRLPIVGRISMDSIILDATALDEGELEAGDLVELIGPNQTIDDVAAMAGTISYEILTSLGHRFERRILDGHQQEHAQ